MNLLAEIPITIPDEEVKQAPLLELEVIDAPLNPNQPYNPLLPSLQSPSTQQNQQYKHYLKKGQIFKINAKGLIDSLRQKADGCVFFGSQSQGPTLGSVQNKATNANNMGFNSTLDSKLNSGLLNNSKNDISAQNNNGLSFTQGLAGLFGSTHGNVKNNQDTLSQAAKKGEQVQIYNDVLLGESLAQQIPNNQAAIAAGPASGSVNSQTIANINSKNGLNNNGLDTNPGKRNFIIRYKIDTKGYYLRDAGEGSGTFVRIDRPLILTRKDRSQQYHVEEKLLQKKEKQLEKARKVQEALEQRIKQKMSMAIFQSITGGLGKTKLLNKTIDNSKGGDSSNLQFSSLFGMRGYNDSSFNQNSSIDNETSFDYICDIICQSSQNYINLVKILLCYFSFDPMQNQSNAFMQNQTINPGQIEQANLKSQSKLLDVSRLSLDQNIIQEQQQIYEMQLQQEDNLEQQI